jgi:hypothetical protein
MNKFAWSYAILLVTYAVTVQGMSEYGHFHCCGGRTIQTLFEHASPEYISQILSLFDKEAERSDCQQLIDIRPIEKIIVERVKLALRKPQEQQAAEADYSFDDHNY